MGGESERRGVTRLASPHYSPDLDWWFNESAAAVGFRSPAAEMMVRAEDKRAGIDGTGNFTRSGPGPCRDRAGHQLSGLSDDGGACRSGQKEIRAPFRDGTTDFQLECGARAARIESAWNATPGWAQLVLRSYYTDDLLTFSARRLRAAHYIYRLGARASSREDLFRRAVESIRRSAA